MPSHLQSALQTLAMLKVWGRRHEAENTFTHPCDWCHLNELNKAILELVAQASEYLNFISAYERFTRRSYKMHNIMLEWKIGISLHFAV